MVKQTISNFTRNDNLFTNNANGQKNNKITLATYNRIKAKEAEDNNTESKKMQKSKSINQKPSTDRNVHEKLEKHFIQKTNFIKSKIDDEKSSWVFISEDDLAKEQILSDEAWTIINSHNTSNIPQLSGEIVFGNDIGWILLNDNDVL